MDVKKFIEEQTIKTKEEYEKEKAGDEQARASFLEEKRKFEAGLMFYPEKTDTLERLKAANGRQVQIVTRSWGSRRVEKPQPLVFEEGQRVLIDGCVSTPLIGNDYIVSITDIETGVTIYENPFAERGDPLYVQKAHLLGRQAGIDGLESKGASIEFNAKYREDKYRRTVEALKKIPEKIEEGKKYIYPEKWPEWEECVCYRMTDLYHGYDLNNALEIMKALDEGKSLEEAEKLINDGHSGCSFGMLCKIVLRFSKRGPEFFRKNSDGYNWSKGEDRARYEAMVQEVERKNAEYALNEEKRKTDEENGDK